MIIPMNIHPKNHQKTKKTLQKIVSKLPVPGIEPGALRLVELLCLESGVC
jgi:hypothetical protein